MVKGYKNKRDRSQDVFLFPGSAFMYQTNKINKIFQLSFTSSKSECLKTRHFLERVSVEEVTTAVTTSCSSEQCERHISKINTHKHVRQSYSY